MEDFCVEGFLGDSCVWIILIRRKNTVVLTNDTNFQFRRQSKIATNVSFRSDKTCEGETRVRGVQTSFLDEAFLEWFVGFFEGDGCFSYVTRPAPRGADFAISIKQDDVQIVQYIQDTLGCGQIYTTKQNVFELRISATNSLRALLSIFSTRLRFPKRQEQYRQWVERFDACKGTQFLKSIRPGPPPDFCSAWLSGFMQAEGYFRAHLRRRKNTLGYTLFLRIILTQNDGEYVFSQLKECVGGGCISKDQRTTRFTISSKSGIRQCLSYFAQFPMRGRKRIAQDRWYRAYRFRERRYVLPEEGTLAYRRFLRQVTAVNRCQKRSPYAKASARTCAST